jgi:hypothetical protein
MKYESRADLLIAAGESIKMQERAGISPMCKSKPFGDNKSGVIPICDAMFGDSSWGYGAYEFPLAVVEGKPVFVGDEMYETRNGKKFTVCNPIITVGCFSEEWEKCVSWNPPKPKTVMVELLREDAERFSSFGTFANTDSILNIATACRKSLEKK